MTSRIAEYLQRRAGNNLRRAGNKFLLVIDNLWADDYSFWKALQLPLHAGGKGSKVLITTRNKSACRVTCALCRPILTGLSDNECWNLIQSNALMENTEYHNEKIEIGNKIAFRCRGSPMAAYTIGKLLNGRCITYWSHMLREMRFLKDDKNGALATLMVSYNHLDYVGRKLFRYCCILPNGYEFGSNQLIRCWNGEQLIPLDTNNQPEEIGKKYFDKLVDSSFIEEISKGQEKLYIMPVLMHDLSKIVSEHEFRDLKSNNILPVSFADQARYASLVHQKGTEPVNIERAKYYHKLRSLKLCNEYWYEEDQVNNENINKRIPIKPIRIFFFRELPCLRVSDLSNSNLEHLPSSIRVLIHLRYLAISNTKIKTIPESVCYLINLYTFEIRSCSRLRQLPRRMRMLINLHHLDLQLPWETISDSTEIVMPPGISEIEHLQTLSRFNVRSSRKGRACNIHELKDLNLTGELCLLNLERVNPENAKHAKLGRKNIENLMLRWCSSAYSVPQQREHSQGVLECLKPNDTLRKFWLINYPGESFPDWMCSHEFTNLNTIRISGCCNFDDLLIHLNRLPQLRDLQVDTISSITVSISEGFPSLKNLVLWNMHYLHTLYLWAEFPKLEKVRISDCPNLAVLDVDPNLREKVELRACPRFVWNNEN